jgi:hypothetical protein
MNGLDYNLWALGEHLWARMIGCEKCLNSITSLYGIFVYQQWQTPLERYER